MAEGYGSSKDPLESAAGSSLPAHDSAPDAARGARKRSRALRWLIGSTAGIGLLVAGCTGENLFSSDNPNAQPQVLSLGFPQQIIAGDSVTFNVSAFAARNVASVTLSFAGAFTGDTILTLTTPSTTGTFSVQFKVP